MSKKNQKASETPEIPAEYVVNTAVLCQHKDGLYYEGKIIDVSRNKEGEPVYTIHYQGWNSRYDERIPQTELKTRLRDHTQENLEQAKKERNEALSKTSSRKRKTDRGGADSRGSTPSGSDRKSQSRAASQASFDSPAGSKKKGSQLQELETGKPSPPQMIVIPNPLKKILQDDSDMINRQYKLPKHPPKVTVKEIIDQYIETLKQGEEYHIEYSKDSDKESLSGQQSQTLQESALGIRDYFDATLGSQLLYKFEKPRHMDLLDKIKTLDDVEYLEEIDPKKPRMSNYYGFVHFLRLFVRLTEMLGYTKWKPETLAMIARHCQDFLMFLSKNKDQYYNLDEDYETAPPDYQKRVWAAPVA